MLEYDTNKCGIILQLIIEYRLRDNRVGDYR